MLHHSFVLLFDTKTLRRTWTQPSTAPSSTLPLSNVCALLLIWDLAFSWHFYHEVQHPEVTSSLVFDGYYLVQLSVDNLWGILVLNHTLRLCIRANYSFVCVFVRASLFCSLKGVVNSMVREFECPRSFSHWIAFLSKPNNRLTGL